VGLVLPLPGPPHPARDPGQKADRRLSVILGWPKYEGQGPARTTDRRLPA